jgi:hypothetical protein
MQLQAPDDGRGNTRNMLSETTRQVIKVLNCCTMLVNLFKSSKKLLGLTWQYSICRGLKQEWAIIPGIYNVVRRSMLCAARKLDKTKILLSTG